MKLSYSMLYQDYLSNTGLTDNTATKLFFNTHLQTRYQDLMASFENWKNTQAQTANTVDGQQYYHYPPGVVGVESATVNQNDIVYPLMVVNSQSEWDYINMYPNSITFIPQKLFPRQYDFGIWPKPTADDYEITLNFIYSTPPLNIADYNTGTVSVTNGSRSVTSAGGAAFTSAMVNRYMVLTDASGFPIDYWYKISGVNDATDVLTLQSYYEGDSASGQNYIIAQVPELPDEAHIFLSWGTSADWFASRGNLDKARQFNNMYYTGDPNNANRKGNIEGGLIGIRNRYAERADRKIIGLNSKNRYYFNPYYVNQILP